MKRLFLVLLLLLVCAIYIIPLLIITVLAYLFMFIGVNQDLTSTRFVVWFITPLTYLEKHLGKQIVYGGTYTPIPIVEKTNESEEDTNVEPINMPVINMWREIIWFSEDGQTDRIRKLHKHYIIFRNDDGFTITKRK